MGPLVENEFKSAHDVLENGFNGVTNVFSTGFQKIEEVLSARVGAIPTVLKDAIEKALDKIAENNFKTPGVKDLVSSGKIDEAVAKIGRDEKQDSIRKKEEIAALLHSDDQKKWDAAAKILDEVPESREARFYQALAYRYWGASQLNRAIEIAEKGLDYATKVEDMKISTTLQNSLAYYYADGGRNDKEPEARKLASLALQSGGMHSVAALDTQGFVLICFGKTKDEVMEGVNFCQQALAKGAPFEFFSKHIQKAETRLKTLEIEIATKAVAEGPQALESDKRK